MRSTMNFVLLCAFGLFAVVYSQEPSSDELKKLSPCYEYVLCKDPAYRKKFYSCFSSLSTMEFQEFYQYLNKNFVSFKSDSLTGAVMEFCKFNESKEKDVFFKSVNADFSLQKKADADGEENLESGLEKATSCLYNVLHEANSNGKCPTL